MPAEIGERRLADAARTLVDVVDDVVGEARQHRRGVAAC